MHIAIPIHPGDASADRNSKCVRQELIVLDLHSGSLGGIRGAVPDAADGELDCKSGAGADRRQDDRAAQARRAVEIRVKVVHSIRIPYRASACLTPTMA